MVRSEAYHHADEFCVDNSRKTSCEDDDGDSIIIRSEWAPSNGQSNHIERRSLESDDHKLKSQVCELLLLHGNGNGGNGPNDSALSSSSSGVMSSTSNEGINCSSMLLSPTGNSGTGAGSVDDKRLRRQIANCNERRRMQSINAGFQALRQLLPSKEGEKMSKAAILQQTAEFIHTLQEEKDRLVEENEIIAQAKRRRIDNSSIIEEQMDTSEDRKTCVIERLNEPTLDVLDCLKTIDELKKELIREQQLRKVFEKELVEVKNKTTSSPTFVRNRDTSGFPSANETTNYSATNCKTTEAYQQIFIGSQPQSKLPTSHNSMMSAFTAISSLQDVLNVSPLLPSAVNNNSVINSTSDVIANSLHSGLNVGYQHPQLLIHTASPATRNTVTSLPSAIIVNDTAQAEERINNSLSTITLTLPSDVVSQLSQTSGNSRQPSHIVLDMANSTTSRFVTVNTNQNHSNPQDPTITTENSNGVQSSTITTTPPNILDNIHQNITQQFRNYANNNLLVQVDQRQSGLLNNSNSQNFSTYCEAASPSTHNNSSIPCAKSAATVINNGTNQVVGSHNTHNIIGNNTTSGNSASLSQRNLQAILDAIRHIEGGSIASSASVMKTSTSSSPCSQANDLLVR